jgi:hypothetical protein
MRFHADLRDITRRIRPDWKIDTPEMPYGKSFRQVLVRMSNAVDQFDCPSGGGQASH